VRGQEPSAHEGAERIDREDEHEHREQERRGLRLLEDREVEVEQLAQAASADDEARCLAAARA